MDRGLISWKEYKTGGFRGDEGGMIAHLTELIEKHGKAMEFAAQDAGYYADMAERAAGATGNLKTNTEGAITPIDDLAGGVGILFDALNDGLIGMDEFNEILGKVQESGLIAKQAVDNLTLSLSLLEAYKNLDITIRVTEIYQTQSGPVGPGYVPSPPPTTTSGGGDENWVRAGPGWEKNILTGEYREAPWQKASGGSVSAGGAYWVGEAGPELFVPSQSGRILSNSQSMSAVGSAMDPYYREEQKQTDLLMRIAASNEEIPEGLDKVIGGPAGPVAPPGRTSMEEIDLATRLWAQDPESRYMSMRYGFEGVPGWETIVEACEAVALWVPYFGLNITGEGFVSQTPANPWTAPFNAPSWVIDTVAWNDWMEQEWQDLQDQWEAGYYSMGTTKEYVKREWLRIQLLNAQYRVALEEAFDAGQYISYGQWYKENRDRLLEDARPPQLKNKYNKQKTFDPVTGLPIDVPGKQGVGMAGGGATESVNRPPAQSGYTVGEGGREMFFPAVAGRVLSNSDAMAALRGASGFNMANFNFNISSAINFADKAWAERELMPYIRKGIREYFRQ
jgi:hypothetical protein